MKITSKELGEIILESFDKVLEQFENEKRTKERMQMVKKAASQLKASGLENEAEWLSSEALRTLVLGRDVEQIKKVASKIKTLMKIAKTKTPSGESDATNILYPVYAWAQDKLENTR